LRCAQLALISLMIGRVEVEEGAIMLVGRFCQRGRSRLEHAIGDLELLKIAFRQRNMHLNESHARDARAGFEYIAALIERIELLIAVGGQGMLSAPIFASGFAREHPDPIAGVAGSSFCLELRRAGWWLVRASAERCNEQQDGTGHDRCGSIREWRPANIHTRPDAPHGLDPLLCVLPEASCPRPHNSSFPTSATQSP